MAHNRSQKRSYITLESTFIRGLGHKLRIVEQCELDVAVALMSLECFIICTGSFKIFFGVDDRLAFGRYNK